MDEDKVGATRFIRSSRARNRGALLLALVLSSVAALATYRGHAAVRPAAGADPPGLLEPSNSCLTVTSPVTAAKLTLWISHLTPHGDYQITDARHFIDPPVPVTLDGAGEATTTISYIAAVAGGSDELSVVSTADDAVQATRVIGLSTGGQPCPSGAPGERKCLDGAKDHTIRISHERKYDGAGIAGWDTHWFVDYRGAAHSTTPFAISTVDGTTASATLPANTASPGRHTITAVQQNPQNSILELPPYQQDSVWVTLMITICGSNGTVPTTGPSTPQSTVPAAGLPTLSVSPEAGPPGVVVTVTGAGFPPNAAVTLAWAPGMGSVNAVADASGGLTAALLMLPHDLLGPRRVYAVGYPADVAAHFVADPGSAGPAGLDAPFVFRQ